MAEDFEIFENSIRQDITTFANIDRPSATGSEDFGDVESDVASNTGTNGRTYVIAIDTLTGTRGGLGHGAVRRRGLAH